MFLGSTLSPIHCATIRNKKMCNTVCVPWFTNIFVNMYSKCFYIHISLWMCKHYVRVIMKLVTNIVYVIFMNYHYIIFHLNQFFIFFPVNFLCIYLFYQATIIIYLIHVINKIIFFVSCEYFTCEKN